MLELELVVGIRQGERIGRGQRQASRARCLPRGEAAGRATGTPYIECGCEVLVKHFDDSASEAFLGGALKFEFGGKSEWEIASSPFTTASPGAVELETVACLSVGGRGSASSSFAQLIGEREDRPRLRERVGGRRSCFSRLGGRKGPFELALMHPGGRTYHFVRARRTLAIDVTLGWVFSKTFEVEFEMSETLAAAAFVATTVLPIK